MSIFADYYDGVHAKKHKVTLRVYQGMLWLQNSDIERHEHLSKLTIPPALGGTARIILFSDGARCEVSDQDGFKQLFPQQAHSLIAKLEKNAWYSFSALIVIIVLAVAGYLWGLPYFAKVAAAKIPNAWQVKMDAQVLQQFDRLWFKTSLVPLVRQQHIEAKLKALVLPAGGILPQQLIFRNSKALGANAFALPGGSIVVLDGLVELSENDDDVIAVLAHELGHVQAHHALRQMLQTSVIGIAMVWYVGDVSNFLVALPAAVLENRYSREFERNADDFAARLLTNNAISSLRLAEMLEKLEQAHTPPELQKDFMKPPLFDYLSTHPNTAERVKALRAGSGQ
ncbi:MAG: M48 family metallopeptidase [Methylococcaceae bacterium]|jgi:Zn-dependent protease with chaperone function